MQKNMLKPDWKNAERQKASLNGPTGKAYGIVALLWLSFQLLWYVCFGFHFDLEAEKYIGEAEYVLTNHHFSAGRFLFYSSTIFVIAFAYVTKLGLYGALFVIMAINLGCYLYFYKALCRLFQNAFLACLPVFFLLSLWPYQSWTLYLYTEALFYSVTMGLFAHLSLFKKITARYVIVAFFWLLLVVLSRPLGILFVPPVLLFFFFKLTTKQKFYFVGAVALMFVALNYIVQVVFTTTPDWNMQRAITEGDIICDVPGTPAEGLRLTNHSNQLYRLLYYITHNFSHFARLALTRLRYFFFLVRPYYSAFHNAYLIASLVFFYGCILLGAKRIINSFPSALLAFMGLSILLFALTIAVQCDDYHNRFFLTLMPFFTVMAAAVIGPFLSRQKIFASRYKG